MMTTISGRVFGAPARDDDANPERVTMQIFARDPDNPRLLLVAQAFAEGALAELVAADYTHGSMITATGVLTRRPPLPEGQEAGNTYASLALTDVTRGL
ncbi:hypothetical protein [Corynebacterium liangguodongii]|uniref:Uncharacterized protein n=1 Tax=Corynebacterium liangguodongii TaxID=2079535 RepID=A0A2S0WCT4_9CORY|nr:hypothetical protein [Corynebacterium liangguodongii]AWB83570.1 hypothetical protein C3E79_02930 [Corynebacterium liangguodongii]PWC00340.1 hypothetical protein DF219_00020 [Corynebacterium liangguodongii]